MKKEITVAVVTAIIVAFCTWAITQSTNKLTAYQTQKLADSLSNNDQFIDVLMNKLKDSSEYKELIDNPIKSWGSNLRLTLGNNIKVKRRHI